jgi:hypothetical protein
MSETELSDAAFEAFKKENPEFVSMVVTDVGNNIIFKTNNSTITKDEIVALVNAWKNHEPNCTIQNIRYTLIRTEDLQLAGKKPGTTNQLVGTMYKNKRAIAFIGVGGSNLNSCSVFFQKWVYTRL